MEEIHHPKRVYLLGMMGSGKSYWSHQLGRAMGIPHFDLDRLVEEREGMLVKDIFDHRGEDYFRLIESDTLKNGVPADEFIMATGGGTPCFFDNLPFMKKQGITVWLNPSITELIHRVKKSPGSRPILAQATTDADLYVTLEQLLDKRTAWYQQADLVIADDYFSVHDFLSKLAGL